MQPRPLRPKAAQEFPDASYEEVLAILESNGKSRRVARHVVEFWLSMHFSEGDFDRLRHFAAQPDEYLWQFAKWLSIEESYRGGPQYYLAHFAAYIPGIAHLAVSSQLTPLVSMGTIRLRHQDVPAKDGIEELYIVPLLNEGGFVSDDQAVMMVGKARDHLKDKRGQFFDLNNYRVVLSKEIERVLGTESS